MRGILQLATLVQQGKEFCTESMFRT